MSTTRVLVVEDERIVALNLKQRLIKLGYDVTGMVASGSKALEAISQSHPDVVLMDINIEGDFDGIETASRIPPELHTPVIYLTAYSEQATLDRAKETKPYGYLLKPFSERELHSTIQMALARRGSDIATIESERRLAQTVEARTTELTGAIQDLKREIGERAKLEETLAQSQKMEAIGQLTGGIAHDFNNLLQGIEGSLTIAKTRIAEQRYAEINTWIDGALSSTRRAAGMTHRLLAFSRRQALTPVPLNSRDLILGMKDLLARTTGEAIYLTIKAPKDLWLTECDTNQLESAILNLAINARDAMPDGGDLTIELCNVDLASANTPDREGVAAGQYVCIEVSDTGCGMSQETIGQAFEPFFTTKPIGQGTGLGLSMVYGFARQSRGYAKITSEVGKGTAISLYLPRFEGDVGVVEASDINSTESDQVVPTGGPGAHAESTGKTIVLVEDEVLVRSILAEMLQDLGYHVIEAADGLAGLAIIKTQTQIDLLVTDVGLPGMNGRQMAEAARLVHPTLKTLFLTGYADRVGSASGPLQPGMHMITKPVSLHVLAARLEEIVSSA